MGKRGDGSIRERRPGVFEIRVATGIDPRSGSTVQRSTPVSMSTCGCDLRKHDVQHHALVSRPLPPVVGRQRCSPRLRSRQIRQSKALARPVCARRPTVPPRWPRSSRVRPPGAPAVAVERVARRRPSETGVACDVHADVTACMSPMIEELRDRIPRPRASPRRR